MFATLSISYKFLMNHNKTPLQIEKSLSVARMRGNGNRLATALADESFPQSDKVTKSQLADFEEQIEGKVVFPWSDGYERDRKDFNDVYPAYPLAIVYVSCYQDIQLCLRFSTENKIWAVCRSGGHSLAGYSVCDGIIIDMSEMQSVHIDAKNKIAIIDSGTTWGRIYKKVEFYNLHIPGGGCPTVAIAGFMQGGGYSLTSRNFGINCDTVLEVTVMLADGKIVVANSDQNQDLYWDVRGGTGNNFGVLLTVKYQLFELKNMFGKQISWSFQDSPDNAALALYTIQEIFLKGDQYPNLGIETIIATDFSNPYNWIKKVYFCGGWIGAGEDFDKAVAPLLAIPGAQVNLSEEGPYSKINNDLLEGVPDLPMDVKAYSRSAYIEKLLSLDDWKNILNYFKNNAPNQYTMVDLEGYGGKINTLPEGTNAFIHRNVTMDFYCDGFFNEETNDQHKNEEFIDSFYKFMETYTNSHSYQNYPYRNQSDFRWAYFGNYYNQLCEIKKRYDPHNFFHYQQSIGEPFTGEKAKEQKIIFTQNNPIKYE